MTLTPEHIDQLETQGFVKLDGYTVAFYQGRDNPLAKALCELMRQGLKQETQQE